MWYRPSPKDYIVLSVGSTAKVAIVNNESMDCTMMDVQYLETVGILGDIPSLSETVCAMWRCTDVICSSSIMP